MKLLGDILRDMGYVAPANTIVVAVESAHALRSAKSKEAVADIVEAAGRAIQAIDATCTCYGKGTPYKWICAQAMAGNAAIEKPCACKCHGKGGA